MKQLHEGHHSKANGLEDAYGDKEKRYNRQD